MFVMNYNINYDFKKKIMPYQSYINFHFCLSQIEFLNITIASYSLKQI